MESMLSQAQAPVTLSLNKSSLSSHANVVRTSLQPKSVKVKPSSWRHVSIRAEAPSSGAATSGNGAAQTTNGALRSQVGASTGRVASPPPTVSWTRPTPQAAVESFIAKPPVADEPSPPDGLPVVLDAIAAVRRGEVVILIDDTRACETGDLIMAASLATAERMAFMVRHGSGIVAAAAAPAVLDRLAIPPMLPAGDGAGSDGCASVSVDVAVGTTTGISAADRARTVRALADSLSQPADFFRPGHIFPLRYQEGGVLKHPGRVEASVDLSLSAGLPPVTALCELVDAADGAQAQLMQIRRFAEDHGLCMVTISDIVRHRRLVERTVVRTATARLPTQWGLFDIVSYQSLTDGIEHVALVKGEVSSGDSVMVRVHSECLTGDIFASERCDCGPQLQQALRRIEAKGRGVCVYLRGHEGCGIGLGHKLHAYNLQDGGRDTVEANLDLGMPADAREYGAAAEILFDLGVSSLQLMTNNPAKMDAMREFGFNVTGRVPVICPINMENRRYLETKRQKMGHLYDKSLSQPILGREGWEDVVLLEEGDVEEEVPRN